jgi:hypothetical protein
VKAAVATAAEDQQLCILAGLDEFAGGAAAADDLVHRYRRLRPRLAVCGPCADG